MSKHYCLSPNALPEWGLLNIGLRRVLSKAMDTLQEAQQQAVKNAVFIEVPADVQKEVLSKRSELKTGKNAVSAEICSVFINVGGKPKYNNEIFVQAIKEAAEKHGNDYGIAAIADGQVIAGIKLRAQMKELSAKIAAEIAAEAQTQTAPNTPPADDADPNTPPADDADPNAPAPSGNTKKSGKK